MTKKFFTKHIVTPEEIDALGHVNNVCYVSWVQNVAEKHWTVLSENCNFSSYVWVVLRHEIDYLGAAKLEDEITLKTWVGESYGAKSQRFVEILKDGKVLVKATTIWCLLDKNSMKVIRIPRDILEIVNAAKE